ncbi:MAG: SDR family oxidoreductase [Brumimicrobium sp.]|nr:SDR family oxidoreductase [Brumimicrobium sp.]
MRVLLTGATGYIGKRLLSVLVEQGCEVVCCVRDKNRFNPDEKYRKNIEAVEVDFLKEDTLKNIPKDIDAAYYLIHSMASHKDFKSLEEKAANNFISSLKGSSCKQTIYLSGIVNEEELSEHLASRKEVENILSKGDFHLTTFRAGIVIGSGSASFEIIRDLVEKLPIMVAPKWLRTNCQPIGIRDVLKFLSKGLLNEKVYDAAYDIGSPDVLTYKEMLLGYAECRGLKRRIFIVPVMTPKLSSYWLYFITSTSYKLATSLVDSMKVEVVCSPSDINQRLDIKPAGYKEALDFTLKAVDSNKTVSSWKDALTSSDFEKRLSDFSEIPKQGCFIDKREREYDDKEKTIEKIWAIGGKTGWYYLNWLWKIRGFLDKLVGGVGLRRGRTHPSNISVGDALDFWRVLYADKSECKLILFAEMKLPGEAWLEFKLEGGRVIQTATFRPKGLKGRLYWYAVWPFHGFIFKGMLKRIASSKKS